jgi:hypothetical protein
MNSLKKPLNKLFTYSGMICTAWKPHDLYSRFLLLAAKNTRDIVKKGYSFSPVLADANNRGNATELEPAQIMGGGFWFPSDIDREYFQHRF